MLILILHFPKIYRLPQIYEEFHHTINNADHQKDLKWWANNHGVNMAMAWPQFEVRTLKSTSSHSHFPLSKHFEFFFLNLLFIN